MPKYLGIDTSNYTTSIALLDSDGNQSRQVKKLLPVKNGNLGLRQSDAVFEHTRQFSSLISQLMQNEALALNSIGVSIKPRNVEASYMPCFLVGQSIAHSIGAINSIEVYETSHQIGHILAGLFSADKLDLVKQKFIAFHISGGTTDCLFCEPDSDCILNVSQVATTLDINAGQAIDRVGVMLGLSFPCGKELEKLAAKSTRDFKCKISLKNKDCCLSGVENLCRKMHLDGEPSEDIAKFCLEFIKQTLSAMADRILLDYSNLPMLFVGGVMSNKYIRNYFEKNFTCYFSEPDYSCDNAMGVAVYAYLMDMRGK